MPFQTSELAYLFTTRYGGDWYNLVSKFGLVLLLSAVWADPLNEVFSQFLGLPFHINQPPCVYHETWEILKKKIWLDAGCVLTKKRGHGNLILLCNRSLVAALTYLIPPDHKWRRLGRVLEELVATLFIVKSLVWLQISSHCAVARKVLALLDLEYQAAILFGHLKHVQKLVAWATNCVTQGSTPDAFGMYAWFGRGFQYLGIARFSRMSRPQVSGMVCRLFEHLTLRARAQCTHGCIHRYRLARRIPLVSMMWLPVRSGPECEIRARESLAIKAYRPNGNFSRRPANFPARQTKKRRMRPPQWRRRPKKLPCLDPTWSCHVGAMRLDRELCKELKLRNLAVRPPNPDPLLVGAWSQSFSVAYRKLQRQLFLSSGFCGPVNIYSPQVRRLMVLWIGTRGSCVAWNRLRAAWKCDFLGVELEKLGGLVQTAGRRRQVLRRASQCMKFEGLPSKKLLVVTVPEPCLVGPCKSLVATLARSSPRWPPHVVTWVLKKTRVLVGKCPTFKDLLSHGRAARSFCLQSALSLDSASLSHAIQGNGMQKVDRNMKAKKRLSLEEKTKVVDLAVQTWCQQARLPKGCHLASQAGLTSCVSSHVAVQSSLARDILTKAQYDSFAGELLSGTTIVRVPDDKDKARMWKVDLTCYHALLLCYTVCSATWTLSSLMPHDATLLIQLVLRTLVPYCLHDWLGVGLPCAWVPYMYVTIKSKCYSTGARLCTRIGHSCCRKIVAYCKWPFRQRWRLVSRACDVILRKWGHGSEVSSLKHATSGLLEDCRNLEYIDFGLQCCKCGCVKPLLNGVVADAGQFFEVVQPSTAVDCMANIFHDVARKSQTTSVTILRRKKVQGYLGGNPAITSPKLVCFLFRDLLFCFAACMYIPFCSLGSTIIRMSGLPIGGLLSRIAASAVLAWEEHMWVQQWPLNFGLSCSAPCWHQAVVARRYIDDVVMISKLLCFSCLVDMTHAMYTVKFDAAPQSRKLHWLDVVLDLDCLVLDIKQSLFDFPPPWDVRQSSIRAFLWGRLARHRQIGLKTREKEHDLGLFLVALARQHFGRQRLRRIIFGMWKDSFAEELRFCRAFVCSPAFKSLCHEVL